MKLQRFYWPTVCKDVAEFCRRCETCQKSSKWKSKRAPLVPLPILNEPFRRIAMDIMGPLPRSHSGNRYLLVICDYATRIPRGSSHEISRCRKCMLVSGFLQSPNELGVQLHLTASFRIVQIATHTWDSYNTPDGQIGGTIEPSAEGNASQDCCSGRKGLESPHSICLICI